MKIIDPKALPTSQFHSYMLGAVGPRPICFASTVDKDGTPNLSPFSFFNAFGSNPPTLIFSPARRVRGNTIKHTLENIYETMEVCINVVNYDMAWQVSLASTEYEKGVNEFEKAGFTPLASDLIKPLRVKESPVQMECRVKQVIETGTEGGAGNLVICEILRMHINEDILDANGMIDQNKIDLVARLGGDWYCRASGDALFEIEKPLLKKGIGIDQLPDFIRNSDILTGNNLGQLGNVEKLPDWEEAVAYRTQNSELDEMLIRLENDRETLSFHIQKLARRLLNEGKTLEALLALMNQR